MIFPLHAFLSRHSFSTRRSLVRRLVSVGGSLIRTADQARGKVGGVKMSFPLTFVVTFERFHRALLSRAAPGPCQAANDARSEKASRQFVSGDLSRFVA